MRILRSFVLFNFDDEIDVAKDPRSCAAHICFSMEPYLCDFQAGCRTVALGGWFR